MERHKAAIKRSHLSRPVSLLVEKGLLTPSTDFFDYGCGHGQDLQILEKNGFSHIDGYDPHYRPQNGFPPSSIINLGYVINVIEDSQERKEVLKKAYSLTKKVLCVSAMLKNQKKYIGESFADGVKTKKGTFQKYYEQVELKNYIESTLNQDAIALHQGIFLIFKNEKDKLEYLEKKYRRNIPIIPKLEELIKESPSFQNVLEFVITHGRIPSPEESPDYQDLLKYKKNISHLILNNIAPDKLNAVKINRTNDLLVMFALKRFSRRGFPKLSDLPLSTLYDIKSFFGAYKTFLKKAEALLFSLNSEKNSAILSQVKIGKILPDAIYIHPDHLKDLPPIARIKVGVAEALIGDVDGCNLIKINKFKDKVSFLVYEDFDEIEHPALLYSYVVDIPKANIREWDFTSRENPPILHRKETLVSPDYPLYEKFKKLSEQEEALGLLGHNHIGTLLGWEKFLLENHLGIIDHKVFKI